MCFLKEEILLEIGNFCGLQAGFGGGHDRPTSELLRRLSALAYTGPSLFLMWIPAYYLKRRESPLFLSRSCLWPKKKEKKPLNSKVLVLKRLSF